MSFVDLAVLVAVVVGLLLLVPAWAATDEGRRTIARQLQQHISEGIRGNVTIGELDHVGLDGIYGRDIVFRDESGRPVLEARSAELAIDWGELLGGHFVSPRGAVHGGRIWLETIPSGEMLLDRAFKSPNPGPPHQPIGPDTVRLEGLLASDIDVIMNMSGSPHVRARHVSTLCLVRAPEHGAAQMRADRIDAALRIEAPHPIALAIHDGTFELDGASPRRAHIVFPSESNGAPLEMVVNVHADRQENMHVAVDLTPGSLGSALANAPLIAQALIAETMADALDVTVHSP